MNTPGDILVARIAEYVTGIVPPEQVRPVTEATCRAVATLMQDPFFVSQLQVVVQLQQENQWLKHQIILLGTSRGGNVSKRSPAKKASSTTPRASTSASKKITASSSRTGTRATTRTPPKASPTQSRAFKQGFKQARRG